jgi:hypothetical protein
VGALTVLFASLLTAPAAAQNTTLEDVWLRVKSLTAVVNAEKAKTAALEAAVSELETKVAMLEASQAAQDADIANLIDQVAAAGLCPQGSEPVCCEQGTEFCPMSGCADLSSDADNCGDCGVSCGTSESCIDGACVFTCSAASDCGATGDTCSGGQCYCGQAQPCAGGAVCIAGACTLCGNGVADDGEDCDPADPSVLGCNPDCTFDECAPNVIFAVGVFGTTTCESRCTSEGRFCLGIGTDDLASNGLFNDCGSATTGVATMTSPGTCGTVLGGAGCSEFTQCLCSPPAFSVGAIFAVGVFGTTTCDSRCTSEGGTCVGIGTNESATDGMFNDCGSATSGVATELSAGSCSTVLGGAGCSEFTNCRCEFPDPTCSFATFAVGVFGTTTCESRCASEGGMCVGMGTDEDATNGLFNDCGSATSGVATTTSPGSCDTVLGGNGCSEFTNCRCLPVP